MQQRKSQTSELRPVLLCANITAGKTKVKKDRSGQSDLMSLSILWWPSNRFLLQLHLSLRSAQNKKERACIRSLYFHIKTGNKYVKWIQKFILLSSGKKKNFWAGSLIFGLLPSWDWKYSFRLLSLDFFDPERYQPRYMPEKSFWTTMISNNYLSPFKQ